MSATINLAAELVAGINALPASGARWLRAHGVSDSALLAWPGPVGAVRIRPLECGLWEPSDTGGMAFIQPALDDGAYSTIIDLVAWFPANPAEFWLRTGLATVLGEGSMCFAYARQTPMPIWRRPLRWLRAHGWGLVVFDWQYAQIGLGQLSSIVAEDLQHGIEIEEQLRGPPPPPLPKILVPKDIAEAA